MTKIGIRAGAGSLALNDSAPRSANVNLTVRQSNDPEFNSLFSDKGNLPCGHGSLVFMPALAAAGGLADTFN